MSLQWFSRSKRHALKFLVAGGLMLVLTQPQLLLPHDGSRDEWTMDRTSDADPSCTKRAFDNLLRLPCSYKLPWPFSPYTSSATPVDIRSILTATPPAYDSFPWTDTRDRMDLADQPEWATVGSPAWIVKMNDSGIVDVQTGEPLQGTIEGASFNLAVLKLPPGSRWGFVGVARGPTVKREWIKVRGHESREQMLIGMGLNITSSGRLEVVTEGITLDIPTNVHLGCENAGGWIATYGGEDPRLFWTDLGTPGITFARTASRHDRCRDIGYIEDLRRIFPALDDAIKPGYGVVPYTAPSVAGLANNLELVRIDQQGWLEKNWVAFYPGPKADPKSVDAQNPHMSYFFTPAESLRPVGRSLRQIEYTATQNDIGYSVDCIHKYHNAWNKQAIHQATPLHRLTLCERGCVPDEHNTVLFGMAQMKQKPRYAKFFATFNITSPFNPISVGPVLSIAGTNDTEQIHYALAMAPIVPSDLDRSLAPPRYEPGILPNHFFLDDDLLITFGANDNEMESTVMPIRDALGRHKMCVDLASESAD